MLAPQVSESLISEIARPPNVSAGSDIGGSRAGEASLRPTFRSSGLSATLLRAVCAGACAVALASCGSTIGTGGGPKSGGDPDVSLNAPVGKVESSALPGSQAAASGDTIGTGDVKVALILPLTSQNGQPSLVGQSLRNAADLAYAESHEKDGQGNAVAAAPATDIKILVKDDHSSPEGARTAAEAAVADGAEIVIGPLFAQDVREVSKVMRGAGKPMIAFSTDTSVATHGTYLLSFLIESYVDRIVDFAASRNKKSIAALIPDNDYGRVADAEFQQQASKRGFRVLEIEHYTPATRDEAVRKVAALGDQIDTLFIPEQADAMPAMSTALTANHIDGKRVQLLGTGLWNDARVLSLPALQGAWFAAPENGGFNAFAGRYRAKYNVDPTRIATLSYDAVSLAAALARSQGGQRFSDGALVTRLGFNGADGLFRFRGDGLNDRSLAVLQIENGRAKTVSPAPRTLPSPSGT